ncbi:MAG: hypothetical protein LBL25_03950 [Oscillospiraceae bacterium]|nr:hypothetical protein [Oscillospiraceae bacterium]
MKYIKSGDFPKKVALSTGGTAYNYYSVSLVKDAAPVTLKDDVILRFPIPKGWNTDRLIVTEFLDGVINGTTVLKNANRLRIEKPDADDYNYVHIAVTKGKTVDATYFIAEEATRIPDIIVVTPADGVYEATVVFMHGSENETSMANSVIDDGNRAYIVVNGGERKLYMTFTSLEALNMDNYMSELYYFDVGAGGEKTRADVLEYYPQEGIGDGDVAATYNLHYPKRAAFPLGTTRSDGVQIVSMIIPAMDAVGGAEPGSGAAEREVRVFITSAKKLESDVNPYAGYDESIIAARVTDAERLIASDSIAASALPALNAAVETAKAAIAAALTSDEIKAAADALSAAITEAVTVVVPVDTSALISALGQAEGYSAELYTETSFAALQAVIETAQAVLDNDEHTQTQIDAAVTALSNAAASLVIKPAVALDTQALEAAILAAKQLAPNAASYETTSYAALSAAVASAEAALQTDYLTQTQVDGQAVSVEAALAALAAKSELKYRLGSGEHSLAGKTLLRHYFQTGDSMGNAAIDHSKSYLEIPANGDPARVHLFFNALSTSGFTGYLLDLDNVTDIEKDYEGMISGYTKVPAQVHSVHENATDNYGPPAKTDPENGKWYPYEVSVAVTPGEAVTIVHVYVPVMDDINSGSGDQLARLVIDWSGFDLTGQNSTADLTALGVAVADADELTLGDYTPATAASVTASLAAAQYLIINNATLTVTTEMAAARVTAIEAAITALIVPPTPVTAEPIQTTPTAPDANGKATASVNPDAINEAIEAAKKDTDNNQIENAVIPEIIINAAPAGGAAAVKELAVSLPAAAVTAVKTEQAALVINAGSAGKVTLTGTELKRIAGENKDLTITLTADATSSLNSAQTAAIPSTAQTPVAVAIAVDKTSVTGVEVSVTVPLSTTTPATGKKFVLIKIAADGTKTTIAADFINGTVTFTAIT